MNACKVLLCLLCLWMGACATLPPAQETSIPLASPNPPSEITPSSELIAAPTQRAETSTPTPATPLAASDEVVLAIENPQEFSGREGDPRPDWLAWGAQTFSIAPDGSLWIVDTAARPQRLLHYNRQGELLQEISLGDITGGIYDLLATDSAAWLYDISRNQVVRLGLDGKVELSAGLPQEILMVNGSPVINALSNLWLDEEGSLLISGLNGLFELVNPAGEVTIRPVEGFSYNHHLYQVLKDPAAHTQSINVDGAPLPIEPPYFSEADPFLGFAADGSVALAAFKEIAVPDGAEIDWLVLYYSPVGELLGVARRWPRTFSHEFAHDLAFGPDGQVYQLVSQPDRTVQVVRLGFQPDWEALPDLPPQPTSLPSPMPLTGLQPEWDTPPPGASDLELARHALVSFFHYLDQRDYGRAAEYFGGPVDYIFALGVPEGAGADFWQQACAIMICMPLSTIYAEERVAEDEYLFYVGFVFMGGTRFESGPCCGEDQAAVPLVWQFAYPVKKLDGQWKVMRGPLYVP